jgi:hypothetical protein
VATFDKSPAFNVTDEKISLTYDIVKTRRVGESIDEAIIESGGELNIRRDDNGKIIPTYSEPFDEGIRDLVEIFSSREEIPRAALMIQSPQLYYLGMNFPFEDIGVYDFQPKLLKNSTSNKQRVRLAEDGVNFGVALKEIIQGAEKRRMFLNLVKSVISFVDDIQVEDYSSESLQILLKETIADSTYLPAWLVSDGTINVAALVAALYFEDGNVKVIEEPEKNIHPRLIGRLVPLLQEVAEKKQVIVTTHSPEVVKYAGKDSLCLIQRDKSGNSTACWPGDSKTLKIFLEEDIGLDDLFVDELIGL